MTVTGLTGTEYQLLAKPFSSGGEGEIYRIAGDTEKRIAKIYHQDAVTLELEEKLKIMVKNHPGSQVKSQVAWPLDVVYNNNSFCGFIMPELDINTELGSIYRYPSDLNISCKQKITIAKNICAVISAVHKAGYVFGDFNPRNIGVNSNTGLVAFLDTDTYHVTDTKSNKVYRCNVCAPGYAAPELLEKCADHVSSYPNDSKNTYSKAPLPTFTKETDNFALAIHIFKLLNNGYTPFGGIPETASASQASPGTGDDAVKRNSYCFKDGNKPQSVAIPPISVFPQELAKLFTRAFIIGRKDPEQRPSSLEWHDVLTRYEKTLRTCNKNPLHQYDPKNTVCPWCMADKQYQDSITQIPEQEVYSRPVSPEEPVSTVISSRSSSQKRKKKRTDDNSNKIVTTQPPSPPPEQKGDSLGGFLLLGGFIISIVGLIFHGVLEQLFEGYGSFILLIGPLMIVIVLAISSPKFFSVLFFLGAGVTLFIGLWALSDMIKGGYLKSFNDFLESEAAILNLAGSIVAFILGFIFNHIGNKREKETQ